MNENEIRIEFDPKTAIAVREPLLNSYGLDLTDINALKYSTDKFLFTVLGFRPVEHFNKLIVTLKVTHRPHIQDEMVHVDALDLYIPDRIEVFTRKVAQNLSVNQDAVKKAVFQLRDKLEKYRLDELSGQKKEAKHIHISESERKEAMSYLKSDNLMDSIEGLLMQSGLVTEIENGLRLFLILQTRHLNKPLHALMQGSPQLCRMLMDTVTATIPEYHIHEQTSMSASCIYYTRNKTYWKNKVLYLKNIDKHFKGANTVKEFIENLKLTRHTTSSDFQTRQLYAVNKDVQGPICLLGYSEDDAVNTRFFQECFCLRVEENEINRSEMLAHIKNEYSGYTDAVKQDEARRMLQVIQQLIEPKNVVIPYANELTPASMELQPLQTFTQLLAFVKVVALLHQHQLKNKKDEYGTEYIEATPYHLEIALDLFKSISVTQSDLLSPRLRNLLESIKTRLKSKEQTFKGCEMMRELRRKRTPFYRDLNHLVDAGHIRKKGGDKKNGREFIVSDWDDYITLQDNMSHYENQLAHIKKEVSQKFPAKIPKAKKTVNKEN